MAAPDKTPRRMSGEGSVYYLETKGHWAYSFFDTDGKRKTRYAKPNTERGAQAQLRKALSQRDSGESSGAAPTVAKWAELWLETRRVAGRRPGTLEVYRRHLRLYVLPTFGATRLDRITPERLDRLYGDLLVRGLSATTVRHVHGTIHALLTVAKRRRLVGLVATTLVEPPTSTRYGARTLTITEARTLLAAIQDHRFGPLWTFLLGTGCRFGEATGLTWPHVDLDAGVAVIEQQATRQRDGRSRSHTALAPVKTDAGRRELQLPAFVVAALHTQHAINARVRAESGKRWHGDTDLVFPSSHGLPLSGPHVGQSWHAMLRACGLEGDGQRRLRLHDLRHTKGTLMSDAGEDTTTIQRTLGHARQSITADLYIGRTNRVQRGAADRYDEMLSPRQHTDQE